MSGLPKDRLSALQRQLDSTYSTHEVGTPFTSNYQIYITRSGGNVISPFHDIPLICNDISNNNSGDSPVFNMVVEIPRWTNAKLEITKDLPLNPITQDKNKKTKALRFVKNVFPHKGYIHNYGAVPQTWEDPMHSHPDTKLCGDNDPLDACEIGDAVAYPGEVKPVKVIGVLALLDEGETDWKILVIDVRDPLASRINNIDDLKKYKPGILEATVEWFKNYKIPDGSPENKFAFDGEAKGPSYAIDVVKQCHESWKDLIEGRAKDGKGIDLTRGGSNFKPPNPKKTHEEPAQSKDKWYYIQDKHNVF